MYKNNTFALFSLFFTTFLPSAFDFSSVDDNTKICNENNVLLSVA